jgi:hypothetical protein
MFAAKSGHSTLGIPANVGKEFTADVSKGEIKKLPAHAKPPRQSAPKKESPPKKKPPAPRHFGSLAPHNE